MPQQLPSNTAGARSAGEPPRSNGVAAPSSQLESVTRRNTAPGASSEAGLRKKEVESSVGHDAMAASFAQTSRSATDSESYAIDAYVKQYSVVKRHHRMGWLRQERILLLSATHIHNCKPPQKPGELPIPTKSFPFTTIQAVGLKMKKSFCIYVQGDHFYFYYTPNSLEIAFEIQRRVSAANALRYILKPHDPRKKKLLYEFNTGTLHIPSFASNGTAAFEDTPLLSLALKVDITKALTRQALDGSKELRQLLLRYDTMKSTHVSFAELRNQLNQIKSTMVAHVTEENSPEKMKSGVPTEDNVDRASRCIEDVLQRLLFKNLYTKLWERLVTDQGVVARERAFQNHKAAIQKESPQALGVPEDLAKLDYSLVLHQLSLLQQLRTPNQMLDQLVNISSCIFLVVHVSATQQDSPPGQATKSTKLRSVCSTGHEGNEKQSREKQEGSKRHTPKPVAASASSISSGMEGALKDVTGPWNILVRRQLRAVHNAAQGGGCGVTAQEAEARLPQPSRSGLANPKATAKTTHDPRDAEGRGAAKAPQEGAPRDAPAAESRIPPRKKKDKSKRTASNAALNTLHVDPAARTHRVQHPEAPSGIGSRNSSSGDSDTALLAGVLDKTMATVSWEDFDLTGDILGASFTDGRGMPAAARSGWLSADDVVPLYIYILCRADVPHACAICEWVTLLSDCNEVSERSYYFTMFASAVEYIISEGQKSIRGGGHRDTSVCNPSAIRRSGHGGAARPLRQRAENVPILSKRGVACQTRASADATPSPREESSQSPLFVRPHGTCSLSPLFEQPSRAVADANGDSGGVQKELVLSSSSSSDDESPPCKDQGRRQLPPRSQRRAHKGSP